MRACGSCFLDGDTALSLREQCGECGKWFVQIDQCGPPWGAVKLYSRHKP